MNDSEEKTIPSQEQRHAPRHKVSLNASVLITAFQADEIYKAARITTCGFAFSKSVAISAL